jgi:putative Mn2+ efflux pump MntP
LESQGILVGSLLSTDTSFIVVCGIDFAPKVISTFELFDAAKNILVAVGTASVAAMVAEALKQKYEAGIKPDNKLQFAYSDFTKAKVTAIPTTLFTLTVGSSVSTTSST